MRPRVAEERKKLIESSYLRDRDFDNDPPADLHAPTVDRISGGVVQGWRWCRHEIENYLLEPEIVARATGWERGDFARSLLAAARALRHYTAARWTVGTARRSLPPLHELATRPDTLTNAIKVPGDLSELASRRWVTEHIGAFRGKIQLPLSDVTLSATYERWVRQLVLAAAPSDVLLWNSGKDLIAVLEPEIVRLPRMNSVLFCNAIRDWITANPQQALGVLPEWSALLGSLAA